MKGLILKDLYLMWKYCRMFFLFVIFASIYSLFDSANWFFQIYPAILVGMIPLTLYSYDEREHWCSYCQTLPVSKRQYVTAKYVLGFSSVTAFAALAAVLQLFAHRNALGFLWKDYVSGILLLVIFGLAAQALILPFIFKLGAEKGRMVYILFFALLGAAAGLLREMQKIDFTNIPGTAGIAVVCLMILAAYAVSWMLSVKFYEKREI